MHKVKKYSFWILISVLIVVMGFFVVYKMNYPDRIVTFKGSQEIKDDNCFNGYSVLVDKEDNRFIGVGHYVAPDDLTTLFSKEEHLELLRWGKYDIYNDIQFTLDDYLVHVEVIETRRMFFEKVYHANISVLYDGYYMQDVFYWDLNNNSIDFTNEQEVKDHATKIAQDMIKKYGESIHQLDRYFPHN